MKFCDRKHPDQKPWAAMFYGFFLLRFYTINSIGLSPHLVSITATSK
jgi:hypothetical protein